MEKQNSGPFYMKGGTSIPSYPSRLHIAINLSTIMQDIPLTRVLLLLSSLHEVMWVLDLLKISNQFCINITLYIYSYTVAKTCT